LSKIGLTKLRQLDFKSGKIKDFKIGIQRTASELVILVRDS